MFLRRCRFRIAEIGFDDLISQAHLEIARIRCCIIKLRAKLFHLIERQLGRQLECDRDHTIGPRHYRAIHIFRRHIQEHGIALGLTHLLAIIIGQEFHRQNELLLLTHRLHQIAAAEHIEHLVVAADLQINIHRHAIVALRQRIQEFVQMDRASFFHTLLEHIALQHLLHGKV